jgi:hypothetical protein
VVAVDGMLQSVRGVGHASTAWRAAVVAAAALAHIALLLAAHGQSGAGAKALVLVPVVMVAWLFGLRLGLVAAALAVPLNALIVAALSDGTFGIGPGDGPTALAALAIAAVSGRLRDLSEVQAALRESERERDKLDGVSLAAREMAHRLNNDLARTVCALDALAERGAISLEARLLVEQAQAGLEAAAADIRRFQQVSRVQTWETPFGPALDLERSSSR